ncbi:MAG: hypothetical protein H6644_08560 [Caldilineaceae bacterium]|nr:hypothetical protein [Caldilineaceae bacterium]
MATIAVNGTGRGDVTAHGGTTRRPTEQPVLDLDPVRWLFARAAGQLRRLPRRHHSPRLGLRGWLSTAAGTLPAKPSPSGKLPLPDHPASACCGGLAKGTPGYDRAAMAAELAVARQRAARDAIFHFLRREDVSTTPVRSTRARQPTVVGHLSPAARRTAATRCRSTGICANWRAWSA